MITLETTKGINLQCNTPYIEMTPRTMFLKLTTNYFWHYLDNLSYKSNFLAALYEKKLIGNEYYQESQLFNFKKEDRVLHVGCGAYPLTEITLASNPVSMVVGIDKDIKAVQRAKRKINEKNLQGKIIIQHGNGVEFPVDDFSVIIISSCSNPKIKILDHIIKNVKPKTKIVVREIQLESKTIIDYIDNHKEIELVKSVVNNPFPFISPFGWHSFLLIRK